MEILKSHNIPLQILVEPHNSLAEGLLLGELVMRDAEVRADGEAVRHATEQVDLPGVACLDEGFLGLVAELGGEDLVDLFGVVSRGAMDQKRDSLTRGSNGQRTVNTAEFLVGNERGVSGVTDVDLSGLHEPADIL